MNFTGTLHGAQVEIRPLEPAILQSLDLIMKSSAIQSPETTEDELDEVLRAAASLHCVVSGANIPNRDGARTAWDQASPGFGEPTFITDVAQIGLLLAMGYTPNV